jgi:hypothetical protein
MARIAPPPASLGRFLEPYDKPIRDLALRVRGFVLRELGSCQESIYDAYNAVAMAYGPTPRGKDTICHIAVYAKYVNLGFNRGASLADPHRLLQGTGKAIRHVRISTVPDLERPELAALLRRAREQSKTSSTPVKGVTSVVKGHYSIKRRPPPPSRG